MVRKALTLKKHQFFDIPVTGNIKKIYKKLGHKRDRVYGKKIIRAYLYQ
ncbi:MAG: hypothetical protein N2505_06515 [Endomicrobia bacterium]|nr:hypothetical protein [Endomicrobiia bacterium]